jgi:hypothetical protein
VNCRSARNQNEEVAGVSNVAQKGVENLGLTPFYAKELVSVRKWRMSAAQLTILNVERLLLQRTNCDHLLMITSQHHTNLPHCSLHISPIRLDFVHRTLQKAFYSFCEPHHTNSPLRWITGRPIDYADLVLRHFWRLSY